MQNIPKEGLKLCHFKTKVKALKLSWVKRLFTNNNATWTILPQFFYNCNILNILFNGRYALPNNTKHSKLLLRHLQLLCDHR